MEEAPRQTSVQSGLYTTISLHAAANALSLAVFLILYHISAVLADFRDAMLYAFLCSIALRGPKDWLVQRMEAHLADDRSLALALLAAVAPPYLAVQWAWAEGKEAAHSFRGKVKEIKLEYQRKLERGRKMNGATPGPEASPSLVPPLPGFSQALTVYAKAGLRTFTSRKERKKRRKRGTSVARPPPPLPNSNRLLLWLTLVCLAWACFEWIRDTWSRTAHIVLITGLAIAVVALIVRALLPTAAAASAASPTKTPGTAGSGMRSPRWSWSATTPTKLKQPSFTETPGSPTAKHSKLSSTSRVALSWVISKLGSVLAAVESPLRALLRRNVHTIVTMALMTGLLVGATGAAAFLSVRIVGEGRGVLLAARDAFPAAWPGVTALNPLLAEELPENDGNGGSGSSSPRQTRSLQQVASEVPLPPWLETYRRDALSLAQRSLPGVASWLEGRVHGLMRDHNLTDTLWDARLLMEAARGPRTCTDRERGKMLVALAKAEVAARQAKAEEERDAAAAAEAQRELGDAVAMLDVAMAVEDGRGSCGSEQEGQPPAPHTPPPPPPTLSQLQERVVAADAVLGAAKAAHKSSAAQLSEAERVRRVAEGRAQLCSSAETAAGSMPGDATAEGLVAGLGARLGSAYTKLFWRLQVREGLAEVHSALMHAYNSITQRSASSTAADLTRLQRLAQVAAVPLFGLGRAAASSLSATTVAAFMGSLGLFKLGLGVVHLAVQSALFLTLLYYLLAAKTDPLVRAVGLLPLPPHARLRAAAALNAALAGVFMSLLKLAAFHGLFAWVTCRALGAPLAYTTSVASAAFALLPFVPTYSVAIPGCVVVALQGRVAAAAGLLLLHFGAYYIGDTLVLEDSGGHPFMMSLAILGGLWAFSNPLLGCLLGPTLLSLLSALGALHTELMGSGAAAGGGGSGLLLSPTQQPGQQQQQMPVSALRKSASQLRLAAAAGGNVTSPEATAPILRPLVVPRSPPASPQQRSEAETSPSVSERADSLPTEGGGESLSLVAGVGNGEAPRLSTPEPDEVESELRRGGSAKGGDGDNFMFPKRNVKFDTLSSDVGL